MKNSNRLLAWCSQEQRHLRLGLVYSISALAFLLLAQAGGVTLERETG